MGHMRKKEEDRRSQIITFWVTQSEYDMIAERAERANMKMSEFIRNALDGKRINLTYTVESSFPDVTEQLKNANKTLSGIGNNLNQVARYTNADKKLTEETKKGIYEIQKDVIEIRNTLYRLEAMVNGHIKTHIE